jgi:hypothetical protein
MTYTDIAMMLPLPTLLVIGLALLNWIFKPPYYSEIDFVFLLVCGGIFYFFVVWCVLLNYGVEVYEIPLV